jgi:hypothetical protein
VGGQPHASATLPPEKIPIPTVYQAGWSPEPFWIGAKNSRPPGFDSRTVQPITSRYTYFAIPDHVYLNLSESDISGLYQVFLDALNFEQSRDPILRALRSKSTFWQGQLIYLVQTASSRAPLPIPLLYPLDIAWSFTGSEVAGAWTLPLTSIWCQSCKYWGLSSHFPAHGNILKLANGFKSTPHSYCSVHDCIRVVS